MKRIVMVIVTIFLLLGQVPAVQGADMDLPVKSAVLMEAATGTVLYEENAHQALAPASVTKVMTLLLIMEAIDSGAITWDDTVTASESAAAKGGSQIYLKVGEQMSVSDMVKAIAVSSANDCACAMAEHLFGSEAAFVERMNEKAAQLELKDTHFVNCTGLDDGADAASHKTSAYDIAVMSRELIVNHPAIEEYTTIWMDTVRGGSFGLSNTNKLVRFYPGATGLKTGFTSSAGYCLSATARRDSMELIAVVMGGETSAGRFAACKSLLDYGFAGYALVNPQPQQSLVPVKLGLQETVEAVPAENTPILVEKSQKNSVTTQVVLDESVTAPVSKGQKLGTLTVQVGQQVLCQRPMVAAQTVEKLEWGQLFLQMIRQLLFTEK